MSRHPGGMLLSETRKLDAFTATVPFDITNWRRRDGQIIGANGAGKSTYSSPSRG